MASSPLTMAGLLISAGITITGCSSHYASQHSSAEETSNTPDITYTDCWTDSLIESGSQCGLLRVPASYDRPQGNTRQVSFAVMPAMTPPPGPEKEPVVFLIGGPGPAGSFTPEFADDGPGAFLRQERQLIMVDYRGVGMSEPYLGCDGPEDFKTCKRVLARSGMSNELRTAVFARDIDRLLEKLGHGSVSIYSGSYGTRVALTMMRDVPQRISHVVLDGVFPPEVNGFSQGTRSILAGLNHIAKVCEDQKACRARLGDIRGKIEQLARNWTALDEERSSDLLSALATFSHYPAAPLLVHKMAAMKPEASAELISQFTEQEDGRGERENEEGSHERAESFVMSLGIVCSEEAAFIDRQPLDTERHGFKGPIVDILRDSSGGAPFPPSMAKKICGKLGIEAAADIETQPVKSNIPTLVLSGGMDLQTSFEWGELAASRLDNAQHFIVPFTGHVVAMEDACIQGITAQFINDPKAELGTECLQQQHQLSKALVLESSDIVAALKKQLTPKKR